MRPISGGVSAAGLRRRLGKRPLAVALGALVLAATASGVSTHPARAGTKKEPPSIVLILTDDQRWDSLWAMPNVTRDLVDHGVSFTNGFVVNSLCCPSRASILTGQYSHTTGVYTNRAPNGGFSAFQPHEGSTIATWLHDAGYRTALFGKYLNQYRTAGRQGYIPPGWDRWGAFAEPNGRYYDYYFNLNGVVSHYGTSPVDYSTDVLSRLATSFIRNTSGPFFEYFAPAAPHGPAIPAPRDVGTFSNLAPARPPNYDEADVSDKPAWVQGLPSWSTSRMAAIDRYRQRTYETLGAVDDAVGKIVRALRDTGRLSNTMIVLASDNGLAFGEHRWKDKLAPYEESIRVPYVVRYDPLTGGTTDPNEVLNIDLAPTFAELAGTTAPGAEGQSFLPLLRDPSSPWRSDFLVEHLNEGGAVPTYCEIRTPDYMYTAYETGEQELYDLAADPYELQNVSGDPHYSEVELALREQLKALCDPPPPGFSFGP